jgi:molybdopterin synthase sulfur carrier subunit
MRLNVKLFASLREQTGLSETTVDIEGDVTVLDVWNHATRDQPMPANTLCAINMSYARPDDTASDGDEIAFFPPVTGGAW